MTDIQAARIIAASIRDLADAMRHRPVIVVAAHPDDDLTELAAMLAAALNPERPAPARPWLARGDNHPANGTQEGQE